MYSVSLTYLKKFQKLLDFYIVSSILFKIMQNLLYINNITSECVCKERKNYIFHSNCEKGITKQTTICANLSGNTLDFDKFLC